MKIKSFEFQDNAPDGWSLSKLELREGLNLFVGATGAGKSRVLNMITNIGAFVAAEKRFCSGNWIMRFEHERTEYKWTYSGASDGTEQGGLIKSEGLWKLTSSGAVDGDPIFLRDGKTFSVSGKDAPKLSTGSPAIHLLREEDDVAPVFDAFKNVLRRNFYAEDLNNAVAFQSTPARLVKKLQKKKDLNLLFRQDLTLSVRLYILARFFADIYNHIRDQFQLVFPHVEDFVVTLGSESYELPIAGEVPILHTKERGVKALVPIQEMSTGMQKVLLIITDVLTGPDGMLYMIDEYENSLGVNAIDFLPPFLNEFGRGRQFLITSHHPHLINAIPVRDWFVFHRKGTEISTLFGPPLEQRYGKSKQQKFTQLLNDPFYTEGVE